jgi:hypothetical protein
LTVDDRPDPAPPPTLRPYRKLFFGLLIAWAAFLVFLVVLNLTT